MSTNSQQIYNTSQIFLNPNNSNNLLNFSNVNISQGHSDRVNKYRFKRTSDTLPYMANADSHYPASKKFKNENNYNGAQDNLISSLPKFYDNKLHCNTNNNFQAQNNFK